MRTTVIRNERSLDIAAQQEYLAEQRRDNAKLPVRTFMEAAVDDPIGVMILARRVVCQESYSETCQHVSAVTGRGISNGAARVRVHRLTRTLADVLT